MGDGWERSEVGDDELRNIVVPLFPYQLLDYDFDMESETIYNPDEVDPEREAYYKDDPKKALRKFFEREGSVTQYCREVVLHNIED